MNNIKENLILECYKIWSPPLIYSLCLLPIEKFDDNYCYNRNIVIYILPIIFQIYPTCLKNLLNDIFNSTNTLFLQNKKEEKNYYIFLKSVISILKIARKMNIINNQDLEISIDGNILIITLIIFLENYTSFSLIKEILINKFSPIDLMVDSLEFICSTSKESEPMSPFEFEMLQLFINGLSQNIKSYQSNIRQEIVGIIKKLLQRLRDSTRKIYKNLKLKENNYVMIENNPIYLTINSINFFCKVFIFFFY